MDHSFIVLLALAPPAVALVMLGAWLHQRATKNCNLVDALWALTTGLLSLSLLALGPGDGERRLLAGLLLGGWSLRLGGHLLIHRVFGHAAEDGRYAALRAEKGDRWNWWSLGFYQLQTLAVLVFTMPALALALDSRPLAWLDWVAVGTWLAAWQLTASADRQLATWRADPNTAGRTCRAGLWSISRHPNYLGELFSWIAVAVLATGGAWGALAWIQAGVAYLLLRHVTGIPYTEAQSLRRRGEDYRAYQREVPPLFPRLFRPRPSVKKGSVP